MRADCLVIGGNRFRKIQQFIEAQNGTITVESELGLGSTFSINMNCDNL